MEGSACFCFADWDGQATSFHVIRHQSSCVDVWITSQALSPHKLFGCACLYAYTAGGAREAAGPQDAPLCTRGGGAEERRRVLHLLRGGLAQWGAIWRHMPCLVCDFTAAARARVVVVVAGGGGWWGRQVGGWGVSSSFPASTYNGVERPLAEVTNSCVSLTIEWPWSHAPNLNGILPLNPNPAIPHTPKPAQTGQNAHHDYFLVTPEGLYFRHKVYKDVDRLIKDFKVDPFHK